MPPVSQLHQSLCVIIIHLSPVSRSLTGLLVVNILRLFNDAQRD